MSLPSWMPITSLQAPAVVLIQGLQLGLVGLVPQLAAVCAWPTNRFIWHPERVAKFEQFRSAVALFWLWGPPELLSAWSRNAHTGALPWSGSGTHGGVARLIPSAPGYVPK